MIYRVEIDWHPEERDWLSAGEMDRAITQLLTQRFLTGIVNDVTIEEDDE